MTALRTQNRERLGAAIPVLLIHGLIGLALLRGFGFTPVEAAREVLKVIDLAPETVPPPEPPPPPPPSAGRAQPERRADPRPEGAASPPNLESQATPIVAPPPVVPLPIPQTVVAAPVPGQGNAPSQGAAPVPGPGTGSGGIGDGTGSGGSGNGGGGGGGGGGAGNGGGGETPPRWLRGHVTDRDYPAGLGEAGVSGPVSVIFTVEVDGRVTDCRIRRSSGSRELDQHTCRLIEQRYRYAPSRDRAGRPVQSQVVEDHEWVVEDLPREPREERRRRRSDW